MTLIWIFDNLDDVKYKFCQFFNKKFFIREFEI